MKVSSNSPLDDVDNGSIGYDLRLPSQRLESNFDVNQAEEEIKENPNDSSSIPPPQEGFSNDDDFTVHHVSTTVVDDDNVNPSSETYGFSSAVVDESNNSEYSPSLFSSVPESNGHEKMCDNDGVFASDDDPVLPPPTEMKPEKKAVLRQWRRSFSRRVRIGTKRVRIGTTLIVINVGSGVYMAADGKGSTIIMDQEGGDDVVLPMGDNFGKLFKLGDNYMLAGVTGSNMWYGPIIRKLTRQMRKNKKRFTPEKCARSAYRFLKRSKLKPKKNTMGP